MKIVRLLDNVFDLDNKVYDNIDKFIIFDIDDTLYKENPELVSERRMAGYKYLNRDLDISFDKFHKLSSEYTKQYGTNYKGFLKHYSIGEDLIKGIDNICGDVFTHFTDSSNSIQLLKDISLLKDVKVFCFSNSNSKQSKYMLDSLDLSQYIEILFCPSYEPKKEVICKPMPESFDFVNTVINNNGEKKILFFDDNSANIEAANAAGWVGIKVDNADEIKNIVEKEMAKHFK